MNISDLKKLKEATENLSKWESSGKSFSHFQIIDKKAISSRSNLIKGADKIYEFYCLMRILNDLRVNYEVKLISGTPGLKIFPEAPANKSGYAYFEIINKKDKDNSYQVCYGTNIRLSKASQTTIAPDISIQRIDSTNDPDESMIELIMDAKFKYNTSKPILIDQIHAFIQRVNVLETKNAKMQIIEFDKLGDLKSNCLITNGKGLSKQKDYCVISEIKQIENFDIGNSSFNVIG